MTPPATPQPQGVQRYGVVGSLGASHPHLSHYVIIGPKADGSFVDCSDHLTALQSLREERDEALATVERLTKDKDHLLTQADGDYLRTRLAEMAGLEKERDHALAANTKMALSVTNMAQELKKEARAVRDSIKDIASLQGATIIGLTAERDQARAEAGRMAGWIPCAERLPECRNATTGLGMSSAYSDPCLCLFPDGPTFDDDGPHVRCCILLDYSDDGHPCFEWADKIDRTGGIDRCGSHGYPVPSHWMPFISPAKQALAGGGGGA